MTILILGSSGMIGTEVSKYFKEQGESIFTPVTSDFTDKHLDWRRPNRSKIETLIEQSKPNLIFNFSGKTRHQITKLQDQVDAILVNSVFSSMLDEIGRHNSVPVLTIGTDCVFSGKVGNYNESSAKDGEDIYAISKIAGEESARATNNLRVSVVGLGNQSGTSLAEWFFNLPPNSKINGYTNHYWNGVPSSVLAKVLHEMYKNKVEIPTNFHLATEGKMSKFEILSIFREIFKRTDIQIQETQTPTNVDRSLTTIHESLNENIWRLSGFEGVPSSELLLRTHF
jgi:dTDP-4-dehydrorhamnose reductase